MWDSDYWIEDREVMNREDCGYLRGLVDVCHHGSLAHSAHCSRRERVPHPRARCYVLESQRAVVTRHTQTSRRYTVIIALIPASPVLAATTGVSEECVAA